MLLPCFCTSENLLKDKLRMEPGEKTNYKSHVWTTARQLTFQNSSNPLQGPRGDITAKVETHQILHYISEVCFLLFFGGFLLLLDIFQTNYWEECHQVTVRLRVVFLLLKTVIAVVKTLQNTQNLHTGAQYLPRLGALAVLLLFLILKKPRPNEDLALRVPKLSSSPVPPWEGDFGGRVAKLLPSTGGLTCSS